MKPLSALLARCLYAALMTALQPVLLLKLWWRARREPLYGQQIAQRLGFYGQRAAGDWVWLHAVSLGETRAAAALVQGLRDAQPGLRLLLTHSTATGWAAGQALLQPGDVQVWAPWDAPGPVRRFFKTFAPRVGLLMETEVWPNWVHTARLQQVPLVLVNARLSARSAQRAQSWSALMQPAYAGLTLALTQSEADAQRLRELGVEKLAVVGNLKYDMSMDATLLSQGQGWRAALRRPVVLLASSREGEEAMWADACARLRAPAQVQYLIVPRHPQRWSAVEALLRARGWTVQRRSAWGPRGPSEDAGPCVWLGDSVGEMALYYGLANVCLLGGSYAPLGGQNLIEALSCGCPVIAGPHMHNFAQALEDLRGDALLSVRDMDQGLAAALGWASDAPGRSQRAAMGQQQVRAHAGAVARTVQALSSQHLLRTDHA